MNSDPDTQVHKGCPAHAGIGPSSVATFHFGKRLPRTRGDRPMAELAKCVGVPVAPHTRG